MSSQGSVTSVPFSLVGDPQSADWDLLHSGSVFLTTPVAANNGETQGFLIDAYGRQVIIGPTADNNAFIGNPVGIGGIHNTALPTYDSGDQVIDQHDINGRKIVTDDQLLAAFVAEDFATEVTLDALNTAFAAEDFASETTLAALNTAFGLEDFASETTLAALNTAFGLEDFASETTLAALAAEDFATEVTLDALLTAFNAEDFASETTLAALSAKFGPLGQAASAASTPVVLSTEQEALLGGGSSSAVLHSVYNNYASANLPGNATNPIELVASTSADISELSVFDTGGVPFEIMLGAVASEVRKLVVGPGADTTLKIDIPSGSRVSIRRIDDAAAVSVGDISINFLG